MSVTISPILGPGGETLPSAPVRRQARAMALAGGFGRVPYDAADRTGAHMAAWNPYLTSPDGELNPNRDIMVARSRDLVRNDGWANGAITRAVDNLVGATYRPISQPDWMSLARETGLKTFDAKWADDYGAQVDAAWRSWAEGSGHYCDRGRRLSFRQMAYIAARHELIDGDSLAVVYWKKDRIGPGKAKYATTIQVIDPDRLSNPATNMFDQTHLRGGVEINDDDEAIAYHIRSAHPGDWWSAAQSFTWDRIAKEDETGRLKVIHSFHSDRAGQHRGGAGILTPVVQRLKMLIKYDGTELDAAIVNAIFGAYVESPMDPQLVAEAMGGGGALGDADGINGYQSLRSEFHKERRIAVGGVVMPQMFPGEKITTVGATRPASNFKDFEAAVLRNVAAGAGLSAQQISNNWSDVNYSSARGALLEALKTMDRRSINFSGGFPQKVRVTWQEEAHDLRDDFELPRGAPEFYECRDHYSRCQWMRPGRGYMDPTKEIEASIMAIEGGMSTLERECAAQGIQWEDVVEQRKIEQARYEAAGIPLPGKVEKAEATAAEPEPAEDMAPEKAAAIRELFAERGWSMD